MFRGGSGNRQAYQSHAVESAGCCSPTDGPPLPWACRPSHCYLLILFVYIDWLALRSTKPWFLLQRAYAFVSGVVGNKMPVSWVECIILLMIASSLWAACQVQLAPERRSPLASTDTALWVSWKVLIHFDFAIFLEICWVLLTFNLIIPLALWKVA